MTNNINLRVGIGTDVHKLTPTQEESSIPVCGIDLPCFFEVEAHSDGDVGLHALTEAMLGAMAEGNIGLLFPPSDLKWKNKPSSVFVLRAVDLLKQKNGRVVNVDVTVICEQPKIMPQAFKMRKNLSELLGVSTDQVSVKATTTEKMGFLGKGEGIAAQAVCMLQLG